MFIYRETLAKFNKDVDDGIIADLIANKMHASHLGVGRSQQNAFDKSLGQLSHILSPQYFDQNLNCAIEYQLRSSGGCRIDFMLSGFDENDKKNIIVIELKQWSYENVGLVDNSQNIRALVTRGVEKETIHPSYQSFSYCQMLRLYYDIFAKDEYKAFSCSYMHDYVEGIPAVITDSRFNELLQESPAFLKHDNEKLRSFIKRYISKPDNGKIFEQLENCEIVPSKKIQDNVNKLILNNSDIVLLDEQRVAYNAIVKAVKSAVMNNKKATFIIKGGPGTGKSVIALKLVGELITAGKKAFYATHNSAPRYAFSDIITRAEKQHIDKTGTSELIKWSGNWVRNRTLENELDLVVVDEAHRLQTSVQGAKIKGTSILKEIIKSSKVSVFFMDTKQFVHKLDRGTEENIRQAAKELGSEVIQKSDYDLRAQFRCGGSDGYIAYLKNILYGEALDAPVWMKDFELKFFKDPKEMMDKLRELNNDETKARVVAGYCYDWNRGNDVTIGDNFSHPWNFDTKSWGSRTDSFEEIGCVYSCQGLEFDYIGVIIGKDLRCENGKIVFHPESHAKTDTSSDIKKKSITDINGAIELIKNHYYVLLTRGVKGCYIYCEDDKLREYLENKFKEYQEMLMD